MAKNHRVFVFTNRKATSGKFEQLATGQEDVRRILSTSEKTTETAKLHCSCRREKSLPAVASVFAVQGISQAESAEKQRLTQRQKTVFVRPDYYKYIQSSAWKKKRAKAIRHHGGKCSICGTTEAIQVHHKTYARLGRERMKDLQLLCEPCHENHHEGSKVGVDDPMTREFKSLMK